MALKEYGQYWATLCCKDWEETCVDDMFTPTSCKPISNGGRPCPDGQSKCGAVLEYNYSAFCMNACCPGGEDWCFDEAVNLSCASIAKGGCPADSGHISCH